MIDLGQLDILELSALLLAGCLGWGSAWSALCRRLGARELVYPPALEVALGLAVVIAIGGVLVAAHVGYPDVLVGVLLLGVAFAARSYLGRLVRAARARWSPSGVASLLGGVAIAAGSVALMFGVVGTFFYNVNDDDGSYVYLAQRLVSTGALIDPFNQQRVTDYGAATLFQALYLRFGGNDALQAYDEVFAAALLLFLVASGRKRAGKLIGTALIAIVVLDGYGIGPIINLTPPYVGAALTLACLQSLAIAIRTEGRSRSVAFASSSLLLGAILATRTTFFLPAAIVIAVALACPFGRETLRRGLAALLGVVPALVVVMLGWCVALEESSSTPLFPIFDGVYTGEPGSRDPGYTTLAPIVGLARAVFDNDHVGWVALVAIAVGLVVGITGWRARAVALLVCSAGAACLVTLFANAETFSGFAVLDLTRYIAPCTLASGLFAIELLWDASAEGVGSGVTVVPAQGARRGLGLVLGACAVLGVLFVMGDRSPSSMVSATRANWNEYRARAVVPGVVDRYSAGLVGEYQLVDERIPPGSKVLAACDTPSLLNLSVDDVATLDLAGAASPSPHMPMFVGAAAKVAYLRRLGFTYLVVSAPSAFGLFWQTQWVNSLNVPPWYAEELALYMLDWLNSVSQIEANPAYPQYTVGNLTLITLR